MNKHQREYYKTMELRDRLIPLVVNGKTRGLLTFYIGNGNINKYVRQDMWSVVDDDPKGETCYVDHLITDSEAINHRYSWDCFRAFINHIAAMFPNVKTMRWNRVKEGKVSVYHKSFR